MYIYLSIVVLFLLAIYFKNYFRSVYLAFQLLGPPALPILGNVLLVNNSKALEQLSETIYDDFGPLVKCWVSVVPFFLVLEPKNLQIILGNNSKPARKNIFYTLMHNFIGQGLITNNGRKWKQNRKLIQPYFHINVLKTFVGIFQENAKILVEDLKNRGDFNITGVVNKCVLGILHEAVLGVSRENTESSPFRKGEVVIPYRITRPWLILNSFFKFTKHAEQEKIQKNNLQSYTREILKEKGKSNIKPTMTRTFLEMLMEISENNSCFTDEDVVNETCTLMLAGQDSVGASIVFTLYFLAKHPEIQDKVMTELNDIFDGRKDNNTTFDDLMEMKYLEQCIKESMRLCPSVPILSRQLPEDITLGKYTLPAGSNILIAPFAIHRLKHLYPNPLKFDPERFSVDNSQKIHPFAYLPFMAGPRNCIGYKFAILEIKMILSEVLRRYHLSLVPGHEELNLSYRITLRAKGGVWLRFKDRETS